MIAEAIEKIIELSAPRHFEVNGISYYDKALVPIKDPSTTPLRLTTLTGIVDYLQANIDELNEDELMIHIVSEAYVCLLSKITQPWENRNCYLSCAHSDPGFRFREWHDLEDFIISMQSMFVQDTVTVDILRLLGNLKDGTVRTLRDDGISQEVNIKDGITKVDEAIVPNPVYLAPHRTFVEVMQPISSFVLRLRQKNEPSGMPFCALFDADGERWKNEAIQNIKTWLKFNLKDICKDMTIIA